MAKRMQRRDFLTAAAGSAAGASAMIDRQPGHATSPDSALPIFNPGDLSETIHAVVKSKRIGQPVFVRITLSTSRNDQITRALALMAEMASSWIGQALERVHAAGSVTAGQVCVTLQFQGGATGLLSYAQGKTLGDGVDVLVLGNHGAIHHDAGMGTLWHSQPDFKDAKVDAKLIRVIEQALGTGKPTPLS